MASRTTLIRLRQVRRGDSLNDQLAPDQILEIEATAATQDELQDAILSQLKRVLFGSDPGEWNADFAAHGVLSLKELSQGLGPSPGSGLTWRGAWDTLTSYRINDLVTEGGSAYIANAPSLGATPPAAQWDLLVAKGYTPPPPAFSVGLSLGTTLLEVGQSVVQPTFSASYNRSPTSAVLTDSAGNPALDVIGTPTSFHSPYTFTKNVPESTVSFTLTADDGTGPVAAGATIYWRQRAYYGVGSVGQSSSAFIRSLSSVLTSTRTRLFTVDDSDPANCIYYAYRAAYGPSAFLVGGFEGGFSDPLTVPVTNAYGFTENYYLYSSLQTGLGQTTVTVA